MIPSSEILSTEFQETEIPSNTHKIVYDADRINGYVDELKAVEQAVYLIMNVERYAYPIYSWNYGVELADLFGMPTTYVIPELERRIPEALLQDDRIVSVTDFEFEVRKKRIVFTRFKVNTIYGDLTEELEVKI